MFALFFTGCGERPKTYKEADKLSRTQRGLNLQSSDRGNIFSCQLFSTFDSHHRDCANKHSPKGRHNPSEMNMFNIGTRTLCYGTGKHENRQIHCICVDEFDYYMQTSNRTSSHSGCDNNCQKLIHRWLCTTAQRIEMQWLRERYV